MRVSKNIIGFAVIFISVVINIIQYKNAVEKSNKEILNSKCNEFTKKNNIFYDCENTSFSCFNHLAKSKLNEGDNYYCTNIVDTTSNSRVYVIPTSNNEKKDESTAGVLLFMIMLGIFIGMFYLIYRLHNQLTYYDEYDAIINFNDTSINMCTRHYYNMSKLVCYNHSDVLVLNDYSLL